MAGQVRHDILAADDEAMVDRNWSTPLADLVLEISRAKNAAARADDAARAAQDLASRKAKGDLASRDMATFDPCIEEGEIEDDPCIRERLIAMSKIANPEGVRVGC